MADPSIVKMPSKKRDQRAQPEVYKSNSAERDNIDSRYQMATIQQGYVNYCLNPFLLMLFSGLSRLSSRHDEEEAEQNQRMSDAPTLPAPEVHHQQNIPPVANDDDIVSEDSLADPDEDFPPPPPEQTEQQEIIVKQEPQPEKATIERSRSPSPVKMAETSNNVPRPPSYEEVVDSEIEPPPTYEYTVKAVYPYKQADEDELSFAKGETILVVKHPHPEEQVQIYRWVE